MTDSFEMKRHSVNTDLTLMDDSELRDLLQDCAKLDLRTNVELRFIDPMCRSRYPDKRYWRTLAEAVQIVSQYLSIVVTGACDQERLIIIARPPAKGRKLKPRTISS